MPFCHPHSPLAVFLLTVCSFTFAETVEPAYVWKPNEVVRFEYSKRVEIVEAAPTGSDGKARPPVDPVKRAFTFTAILIIEVNKAKAASSEQIGLLRFDSPHIDIPEDYWYSSQADEITMNPDKDKLLERAFEGAVKSVRWGVRLGTDGSIKIDSRVPKSIDEWLKDASHTANWRAKYKELWATIVEKNLGLGVTGEDRDILLVPSPRTDSGSEFEKIRPVRSELKLLSHKDHKATFSFQRIAPPHAGEPFAITAAGLPSITIKLQPAIVTQKGTCIFDTFLWLPDSISETYSFKLEYDCKKDSKTTYTLSQDVTVKYELKRLAPKIDNYESATEAPAK